MALKSWDSDECISLLNVDFLNPYVNLISLWCEYSLCVLPFNLIIFYTE